MRILLLGTTAIYAGLAANPVGSQTWTDENGTSNWGEAGNWSASEVPAADGEVVFSGEDGDTTVQISNNDGSVTEYTVNSLDIQSATQLSGGTLILDGAAAGLAYDGPDGISVFAGDLTLKLQANAVFTMLANFVSEAVITATEAVLLDVDVAAGKEARFTGALAEEGAGVLGLEVSGQGTVVLEADNTYTGATTVASGGLDVTGTLASSDVSVASGATLTTDGGALAATTTLSNAGAVEFDGDETIASLNGAGTTELSSGILSLTSGASEVDGVVSGAGGLTIAGGM